MSDAAQATPMTADFPSDVPETMDVSVALTGLDELPLPPPVSYMPQTWGWGVVAVLIVLGVAWCVWRAWRRYRRDHYRRLALAELERLAAMSREPDHRTIAVASMAALLKRTALAAYPAENVGAMRGATWIEFLNRHRGRFEARDGQYLAMASYAPRGVDDTPQGEIDALVQRARQWIHDHHVEV
ncbi:hypothetical protein PCA31118_00933 [Pandoraea captiosa]|uniref:DUF4381 domain-containing protein n=1 Tax=Pandoraea captiosa TaxID=2508302 RepID=A0A5E4ZM14_9BURK|nr:DUF4381 domain-containing protein [Pandoraea captiosa]VVE62204.1 hypothetical protein PCA31118_00933 [Pandoraea captiosa]